MKQLLTKILSVILAFSVLFATTSFTVDMHYCCDTLVDSSVFGKAKNCEDELQKDEADSKEIAIFMDDECCTNQIFIKEAEENIKKTSFELETETIVFLKVYAYTYINLFEGLEENIIPFKDYRPPLISKDNILVLHETFLI